MRETVLGLGIPSLDHILHVSDEFLKTLPGDREGLTYISYEALWKIIQESGASDIAIVGGSVYNTLRGLSSLNIACTYFGPIGNDMTGKRIRAEMASYQIHSCLLDSSLPTAHVLCLVTPDGKRTFKTFLGAGAEVREGDLMPACFRGIKLVHLEGYLLENHLGAVEKAILLAKEAGCIVSLDLGAYTIVQKGRDNILKLLKRGVDVVFANELEAQALVDGDPKSACKGLLDLVPIAVVLSGSLGCWLGHDRVVELVRARQVTMHDSTGAGDLFAAGFLFGFLKGKPILTCAEYGNLLGAAAVQVSGAKLPPSVYKTVSKLLRTGYAGSPFGRQDRQDNGH